MGKVLDIIIKIVAVILILFILYCLTFGRDFGMKQVNKVIGMYYVNVGDKAFKKHNMQEAINAYENGLHLFPEHYEAWLNLGNIYVAYEDYFSATQAYENAILAKNNYSLARMNLGIITAEKLGDFDSAIDQYQRIIMAKQHLITIPFVYDNKKSETANKAIAYYNMGKAYSQKALYLPKEKKNEKRELLDKAAQAYENAVKIVKNDYNMFYNLALTYHILGDYRKAGEYYCSAIDVGPMNYEAHYNLGLMLRHLNQETYAIDELEKAAVLATSNDSAHSKYIFDILSAVSMEALQKGMPNKIIEQDNDKNNKKKDNKKNQQDEQITDEPIMLVKGKVSAGEEKDTAIIESFKKCSSKHLFDLNNGN
ncbi:tetratricopeptide repeat protein [bacterium]|nr:tetratricopeptide repeat protein [bacterium]